MEVNGGGVKVVGADLQSPPSQPPTRSHLLTLEGTRFHRTASGEPQDVQRSQLISVAFARDVDPSFYQHREGHYYEENTRI